MSKSFTPGPWEPLKGLNPDDEMRCGVVAKRKGGLAFLVATIENGAPGDVCDTEWANARLIASAPDLLEALVEVTSAMRRYEMDVDADAPAEHREMMRKARAAIAKARGDA